MTAEQFERFASAHQDGANDLAAWITRRTDYKAEAFYKPSHAALHIAHNALQGRRPLRVANYQDALIVIYNK